jgi:hypothetical protein
MTSLLFTVYVLLFKIPEELFKLQTPDPNPRESYFIGLGWGPGLFKTSLLKSNLTHGPRSHLAHSTLQ